MHHAASSLFRFHPALMQQESGWEALKRIWYYINYPVPFGNLRVSLGSLVLGVLVFALTLFLSRTATAILDRRMSNRKHLDPGLRYTIARLFKYFLVAVGLLIALKQAFGIDLTSIAVVFTALSV